MIQPTDIEARYVDELSRMTPKQKWAMQMYWRIMASGGGKAAKEQAFRFEAEAENRTGETAHVSQQLF